MKFTDLLNKDHYRSIIAILSFYQIHRDKEGKLINRGLRPIHLRYALMEHPGLYEATYKKVKDFFANPRILYPEVTLHLLYEHGGVVKGCIKSPQKLINYLTELRRMDIVARHGKRPFRRYTLTPTYLGELAKNMIKSKIENWHCLSIIDSDFYYKSILDKPNGFIPDKTNNYHRLSLSSWTLYGFSPEIIERLSDDEKNKLSKYVEEIEKNLWRLVELKYSRMKIPAKRFVEKVKKNELPLAAKIPTIAFYYEASRRMVYG